MAHKKGMGSTKNGRDSESKRLGDNIMILYLDRQYFCKAAGRSMHG